MEEVGETGVFPLDFEIGDEALDEDDIERAIPHDLIGDVHITASGVSRLWTGHGIDPAFWRSLDQISAVGESGRLAAYDPAAAASLSATSSVQTLKPDNVFGPNVLVRATSAASRP